MAGIKISDIAKVNPPKEKCNPEMDVSFVPMESLDDLTGEIVNHKVELFKKISSGHTSFVDDDVIFAKITPCMENGKCAVAKNLKNGIGFGSTEFYVIRPNKNVLSKYIWYFLRQEKIRGAAKRNFTGASGHKRVPKNFIENLEISLPMKNGKPDIVEQKKIVAKIDKLFLEMDRAIEQATAGSKNAKKILDGEIKKIYEGNFSKIRMGEIISAQNGYAFNSGDYTKTGYNLIRITNVQSGFIELKGRAFIPEKLANEKKSFILNEGDLLISLTGNVGRVGIIGKEHLPAILNQRVSRLTITNKNLSQDYLFLILNNSIFGKKCIKSGKGTAQQNISNDDILNVEIPVPTDKNGIDARKQKEIMLRLENIRDNSGLLLKKYQEQINNFNKLKQSILNQAFQGKL